MMKTKLFTILFSLLLFAGFASGQYVTLSTITLTNAVSATETNWTVSSTTSLTAPSVGYPGTGLFVDGEFLTVDSIINSTQVVVKRHGGSGSLQVAHLASAIIFYGAQNSFYDTMPLGTCLTNTQPVYPWIDTKSGVIWLCYGSDGASAKTGVWKPAFFTQRGDLAPLGQNSYLGRYANVAFAGTAYSGIGTTLSPTTTVTYVSSVDLPVGKYATGVSYLAGTTNSGTPHATVAVYGPQGGTPLAYSATTAVTATASIWEDVAFTAKVWLPPGRYFIGLQTDASNSHITTFNTGYNPISLATTSITGGTYGTIATVALTAPTTFTTAVGPVAAIY